MVCTVRVCAFVRHHPTKNSSRSRSRRASATAWRSLPELQRAKRSGVFFHSLSPLCFLLSRPVRYTFYFIFSYQPSSTTKQWKGTFCVPLSFFLFFFFVRLNSLTRNGVNFLPVLVTFTPCRLGFLSSLSVVFVVVAAATAAA